MSITKVTIVDFGLGNLFSIAAAIKHVGGQAEITSDPREIASANRLILPGVGAFGRGMNELGKRGIANAILEFVQTGRPILGICLGMQLLMTESYEFGHHRGLDLIKGKVVRFNDPRTAGQHFKIPQIGWNKIEPPMFYDIPEGSYSALWRDTILQGVDPGSFLYFVHSYICVPDNSECILAESVYGEDRFCCVIHKDNIWGCQFHPERSSHTGLQVYKNLLGL